MKEYSFTNKEAIEICEQLVPSQAEQWFKKVEEMTQ